MSDAPKTGMELLMKAGPTIGDVLERQRAELARLRAENEALKKALYRIAITDDADCLIANDARSMTLIAREVLRGA